MKAIVEAFFKAVNAVIVLFGGTALDVDAQVDSVFKWMENLEINVD